MITSRSGKINVKRFKNKEKQRKAKELNGKEVINQEIACKLNEIKTMTKIIR